MFALEAVGSYYSLRNYLKSFYVAVIAAFTSRLAHSIVDASWYIPPVWSVTLTLPAYSIPDLLAFALLGIVMGLLGVVFTIINVKLLQLRDKIGGFYLGFFKFGKYNGRKWLYPLQNKFLWAILITIATSVVTFPRVFGEYMSLSIPKTIEMLFFGQALTPENGAVGGWVSANTQDFYGELFKSLAIFVGFKYLLSHLTVSLPIPGGIYVPLLVMGAGFGRIYGEMVAFLFQNGYFEGSSITPGGYALVGAVAMTASATQAFSTVFIVLEVAGSGVYLPSLMAALIAVRISRSLYYSAYDSVIKLRGWPAVMEIQTDGEGLTVQDIMNYVDSIIVLEETTTFGELQNIFEKKKVLPKSFPVVNNKSDLMLLGTITLQKLKELYEIKKEGHDHDAPVVSTQVPVQDNAMKREKSLIYEEWEAATSGHLHSDTTSQSSIELMDSSAERIVITYTTCQVAVSQDTPAVIAHMLFSQLRLDDLYVVWMGRLMGQLYREVLVQRVVDRTANIEE